jgi:predicted HD superfamily hydrolase involved in NAD metabolism
MTLEDIKIQLEKSLPYKRFVHSVNVMKAAQELAARHKENEHKAALAGLLHDCARRFDKKETLKYCESKGIYIDDISFMNPVLLHGPAGSYIAKEEYGVDDEDILSAIYCHTTGKENMSILEKIVFIADYIEPGRDFPGVGKVRNTAFKDLDGAVLASLEQGIIHVILKGTLIHQDSVKARNYILMDAIKRM